MTVIVHIGSLLKIKGGTTDDHHIRTGGSRDSEAAQLKAVLRSGLVCVQTVMEVCGGSKAEVPILTTACAEWIIMRPACMWRECKLAYLFPTDRLRGSFCCCWGFVVVIVVC